LRETRATADRSLRIGWLQGVKARVPTGLQALVTQTLEILRKCGM